jgi:hypothetical protein
VGCQFGGPSCFLAIIPERDAVGFVINGEGRINKVAKLGVALLDTALSAKA